jgi:hypothetical protein
LSERVRTATVWILVVVASVAIVLALAVGYVRRAAVDSDQFANRATAALRSDPVRSLAAQQVTDEIIIKHQSDLIGARPLIESIVSSVVGGGAFTSAFRSGVRDVHRAVFDRDQDTVTLALADVGTMVAAGLEFVRPGLADQVRATGRIELLHRDIGDASAQAARASETITILAWLLLGVALAAAGGAIWLARDRRQAVIRLGVGAVIGGFLLVVALGITRSEVIDTGATSQERDAIGAVWDAFLKDLQTAAWILAACGTVVAAAAASLIRPIDVDLPLRRAYGWIAAEPERSWLRVVRGVALIAVGLVFVLDRDAVIRVLFTAVGLYLIYAGVSVLLWLVYRPRRAVEHPAAATRRHHSRPWIAALVAGVLIIVAGGIFVGSGGTSTAAPPPVACNGHEELCGRTLEDVALPATHNSMSGPLPGWYTVLQDRPIPDQLRDGIRGLLIDAHYADRLSNGRLRTELGSPEELRAQVKQDGVSQSAVDAALRTRDRLGFSGKGVRGTYLCHTFCELGGTPLSEVLTDLHDFLVANPGEVLVVINQDYVTPKDFVEAVDNSGLGEFVYRGPTAPGRWPTLREMIDSNQRVVFLAENHAGAAPWYHPAYDEITMETPFSFSGPAALTDPSRVAASCRPDRGPANGAPLFLVNNWITTDPLPRPSNAEKVNAYAPLLHRLEECMRVRQHIPNLVAVDFYRRGGLVRAVDAINGVTPG